MNDQPANLAQLKYRRGTILGLTVAEVFILLLFLLMLVFLVLSQEQTLQLEQQQEEIAQQEQEMRNLQTFRDTWEEPLAGIETPDEIITLKRLSDSLTAGTQGNEAERLLDQLVEAERQRNEAEAGRRELEEENERLLEETASQQGLLNEQQEQIEDLREQGEEYREIAEEQRILREKGQNPPCWYEVVPAANGGIREKAFYLFDIAVFDQQMVVRRLPIPSGGAFDDSDRSYAEEALDLPLEEIRYDTPLADDEVIDSLSPLFNAGKESQVRTYSCVFFVQVWDETSDFAKERWQQAHDRILEGLFGTFTVRDEPWQPM